MHAKLQLAKTASQRMDALCEFIEFWLGPRKESYGIPPAILATRTLPMPLERLYRFAGRWPAVNAAEESPYVVSAFAHQDNLSSFEQLKPTDDGKLGFVGENQACWHCVTLPTGDDPPVWCDGDFFDDEG